MKQLHFTIPIPPSLNHAYRTDWKTRTRHATADAVKFKQDVGMIARVAANAADWKVQAGDRLSLTMVLRLPTRRRRDIDNTIKLPLDAIASALEFDDTIIDEITVRRGLPDKDDPRCIVILTIMEEAHGK